jgi:superfamily I DNA/RNA helicase
VVRCDAGVRTAYYDSLPGRLAEAADAQEADERFDLFIVDEAQDFSDDWWPPLLATLSDPADGPVVVFQDDLQRIFAGRGHIPFHGVEVELDENLRNTQEIAAVVDSLQGRLVKARGPEGPPVRLVRSSDSRAVADADRVVAGLIAKGYPPSSIAVLTTYRRHPVHDRLARDHGPATYSRAFDSDEVFYATVQSFKGLKRPAVVLAVNGFNFDAVEREILHVGMSRARSLLVVVADLQTVAAVDGGPATLERLQGTTTLQCPPPPVRRPPSARTDRRRWNGAPRRARGSAPSARSRG